MKKTIIKINKTKHSLFEKINKLTTISQSHQEKKGENQINKIRREKGQVTKDNAEIQSPKRPLQATIC